MRCFVLCLLAVSAVLSAHGAPRGVAPDKAAMYEPQGGKFTCLDGGRTIPYEHVNDDYCDCEDGSDEPGTAACAGLQPVRHFWCLMHGDVGEVITASLVNDGICDCCDGSDEYASDANCPNTCEQIAAERAAEQARLKARREAGLQRKAELVAKAKEAVSRKEEDIQTWRREKEEKEVKLGEAKVVRDTEEQLERDEREKIRQESEVKRAEWEAQKQQADQAVRDKVDAAVAQHGPPKVGGKVLVAKQLKLRNGRTVDPESAGTVESVEDEVIVVKLDIGLLVSAKVGMVYPAEQQPETPPKKESEEVAGKVKEVCVEWRQTAECKGDGPEEGKQGCSAIIESGLSGFCKCMEEGVETKYRFDCGHERLRCQHVCETAGTPGIKLISPCPAKYPYPIARSGVANPEFIDEICYNNEEYARQGTGPCGSWCARDPVFFDDVKSRWEEGCGELCSLPDVDDDDDTPVECDPDEQFKGDDGSSYQRPDATTARSTVNTLQSEVDDLQRKIDETQKDLEGNYGPEKEFLPLKDECFEYKTPDYTYKLCPFKDIQQGYTSMGKWSGWGTQTYGSWGGQADLSIMKYENGQTCWNGPARSTEVKVKCGPENVVVSVDEPSMCTYTMVFETPAACQ